MKISGHEDGILILFSANKILSKGVAKIDFCEVGIPFLVRPLSFLLIVFYGIHDPVVILVNSHVNSWKFGIAAANAERHDPRQCAVDDTWATRIAVAGIIFAFSRAKHVARYIIRMVFETAEQLANHRHFHHFQRWGNSKSCLKEKYFGIT